jgi:hypothetical protein
MGIQQRIQNDLNIAIKEKNIKKRENLKVIISEFQRQKSKTLESDSAIRILKKLKKWERDRLSSLNQSSSDYLELIDSYLPDEIEVDELEIKNWIVENIDFSKYKNKLVSIKDVKAHFGSVVDGNTIKNIILKMDNK